MPLNGSVLRATCAVVALFASFFASASAPQVPCAPPRTDGDWPVAHPDTAGFDPDALCALIRQAVSGAGNIHGIVVEREGRIVAELYRNGPDRPINVWYGLWNPSSADVSFDATTLHDVRSISKSIVGLLYGIEVGKGKASKPGTPVMDAYPALKVLRDGGRTAITFGHVLTMSSGLDWSEGGRSVWQNDELRLFWKKDLATFVFDRPLSAAPGTKFSYNGGGTAVLADALVRATGMPLAQLARLNLFDPLSITRWEWVADLHGRPLAFAGLRLGARDMLKIGRLMNDRGRWRGRQVIPEDWVAQSMVPRVSTGSRLFALAGESVGYGYQWWLGRVAWRGREVNWASAIGNGGQRIFVVPELSLGVVMTAGEYDSAQIHRTVSRFMSMILQSARE
jgi:CubicO group peptidase (beta-lactamase class C family)